MKKALVVVLVIMFLLTACGAPVDPSVEVYDTNEVNVETVTIPEYCMVMSTTRGDGEIGGVRISQQASVLRCEYETEVCWIVVAGEGTSIDCFEETIIKFMEAN